MDQLSLLSCFVRVAESGSFSVAARDLGRSQSAISQQIRALEARLNARLVDRTTRRVSLTEAGTRYLENAKLILEMLAEADATVSNLENSMTGRLAVSGPVNFGTSVLGRFLFEFRQTHPGLQLDVSLSDRFVDLIAEGFDVAIRMGAISDPNLVVRKIGTVERRLAATPSYLDRVGRPRTPKDLEKLDYVVHSHIKGGERFTLTNSDGGAEQVSVSPALRSDNSHLICEAIAGGVGVGVIHEILLTPMVASGVLEQVLPNWRYEPQLVHAVYPSNRYVPRRVRKFVDGFAAYLHERGALVEERL
ncbi:LysR family transcriptional regulator [Agrobacterium sp. MOPV5]|uniref:LysR family transcriptional regulator n=1 Tax=Agrobacterium leguminum TaxID=2792015 RepID=UPI0018C21CC4|nr:LysR family transcriptional regulator [Agrobacterium leguminum]MBG0511614.1 LysR family transcriptional regulator [Agrobacterium leguminum]